MRIAVAGGTGVVGRHVVVAVEHAGHTPVVLARSTNVDLVAGKGVSGSLDGVDAVIDVTNTTTMRRSAAVAFFTTVSQTLRSEAARAGVQHLVVLSIVGVDRVPFGYYEGKLAHEKAVLDGPVPSTVLRAAQFHEFPGQLLDRVPGPVAVLPRQRIRPVAAREVGEELVRLAEGSPQGLGPEIAGPDEHDLADLARRVSRARGRRRPVLEVRLPGETGRQLAGGGLLPQGPFRQGTETFSAWLERSTREGTA